MKNETSLVESLEPNGNRPADTSKIFAEVLPRFISKPISLAQKRIFPDRDPLFY